MSAGSDCWGTCASWSTPAGCGARIHAGQVPVLPEAWDLARQGAIPDGSHNNARFLARFVDWAPGISAEAQAILCDAQTSGGLLMATPAGKEAELLLRLQEAGVAGAAIGEIVPGAPGQIAGRTLSARCAPHQHNRRANHD